MWKTIRHNGEVHIVPIEDSLAHEFEDCGCQPEQEPVEREDGTYGWVVVHSAWDGRKDA